MTPHNKDWTSNAIPLSLHGDGVPVIQVGKAGAKTFDAYSIQSIWSQGSTLDVKILMFGVFSLCASDSTWEEVWRVTTWSLHWLSEGIWPPVDWHGKAWTADNPSERALAKQPLADGLFAIVYALKGDLDYFARSLHLRHYNADQMCDLCPASRCVSDRTLLYNNFDRDARWMALQYTVEEWRELYKDTSLHWLFNLNGVTNLSLEPDELHIWHLGVGQYTLGSVLHLLTYTLLPGTPSQNMARVWEVINKHYVDNATPCQFTNLGLSSFVDTNKPRHMFPRLKGKAAEIKDVTPAILDAWLALAPRGYTDRKLVETLLVTLVEAQDLLHESSKELMLPLDEAAKFQNLIDKFLATYQRVSFAAEEKGDFLWNNPTKFHHFWHLARKAKFLHPRRTNTYVDEDFVGKIKTLVFSCSAGSEMHQVTLKMAEKYRWGMHFLMQ